jgi:hypothetical protein
LHWVSKTYVVRLLLRPDDAVLIESVSFLGGRSPISSAAHPGAFSEPIVHATLVLF